ncbi:hypothetical protein UCRPA7_2857 [Phaeoacremonium minimum UCRPA7]|uniref:Uncharacterized protein n=1 Tax=Phaeoacremonium minimum (strain UCR-PA7) TaxID=1286976 RepID=R8BQQ5_PHAM7|nr:hypothetical protein UCRPA7_2857 [Phaeoacremonium minimum UCRPA7]EOO01615.1 hypothetical protein UCRPA7_2857 [Phaeoacremonium minimum UCRPA7]
MPSYELTPQAFTAPTDAIPYMTVTFRVPQSSARRDRDDPIFPASGLQLSLENNRREAFLEERLTARDLGASGGVCVARVPAGEIPQFRGPEWADQTVVVKMHAWKGEKWLGSWEVGRMEAPLGR